MQYRDTDEDLSNISSSSSNSVHSTKPPSTPTTPTSPNDPGTPTGPVSQLIWMSRQHSVRKMVKDAERSSTAAVKRSSEPFIGGHLKIAAESRNGEDRRSASLGSGVSRPLVVAPRLPRKLIPSSVRSAVNTLYSRLKSPKAPTTPRLEEHVYDNIPARMPSVAKVTEVEVAQPIEDKINQEKDMELYGRHRATKNMIGQRYAVRKPTRDSQLTLPKRRTRKGRSGSIKDTKNKNDRIENVYTKEPKVVSKMYILTLVKNICLY